MSIIVAGVLGRLVSNPQLRFTTEGQAMVRFMLATESVKRNRRARGEESVWRCAAWHVLAVNIGNSLRRRDRIFVQGRLKESSWTGGDGLVRPIVELIVDGCGPSLKFAAARISQMDDQRQPKYTEEPWAV